MKKQNLSTLQYLDKLNIEWWVNNFRKKIYPKIKDKEYYKRVCELKKNRIIEISQRNNIDCIFDNEEKMRLLNNKFKVDGGIPLFEGLNNLDLVNYYYPNSDCRVFLGNSEGKPIFLLGKIKNFFKDLNSVEVLLEGDSDPKTFLINKVARIL
jgi:hypothetical protein